MAETSPPSIAVVESASKVQDGREVKASSESLLSRSDSGASADEAEEADQTSLSVPSSTQSKPGRKGRKISVNEALKVCCCCAAVDRV